MMAPRLQLHGGCGRGRLENRETRPPCADWPEFAIISISMPKDGVDAAENPF